MTSFYQSHEQLRHLFEVFKPQPSWSARERVTDSNDTMKKSKTIKARD
jgi:hypothetical protein